MAASSTAIRRQVSIPTKIAYGMGQGISSVKDMLFHFFFLFYFTNILGVSEFAVIISSLIALFVDAVSDPIMGQITDNYRSKKWGRRHIFMAYSIMPTGLLLTLLFSPPEGLGEFGLFCWMTIFAILVRLALTAFRVPYYSLGAELSDNYNERTNIVSVREIFNGLFNMSVFIIGFLVFLPDSPQFEDGMMNKDGYAPLALTMAIIGCIGALVATFGTKHKIPDLNRHENDEVTPWHATFTELAKAAKLKSFRWVTYGYSSMAVLYGIGGALSFYYGVYLWQFSQEAKSIYSLVPLLVLIPVTVSASFLAANLDKREAVLIFATLFFLGSLAPYLSYTLGMMPSIGDPALLLYAAISHGFAMFGIIGIVIICYSMLADVADEMELMTTKRQEGILYAAFSFIQKMTFAAGTTIASIALVVIEFPKQTAPSDIPQHIIDRLAQLGVLTAVIFGVFTIISFMGYPLNRKKVLQIQDDLQVQRTQQAAE